MAISSEAGGGGGVERRGVWFGWVGFGWVETVGEERWSDKAAKRVSRQQKKERKKGRLRNCLWSVRLQKAGWAGVWMRVRAGRIPAN